MNTSLLSTPFINRGDPITAAKLNQLADAAKRSFLQPGQFQNGALAVSAFGGAQSGGTTLVAAIILESVEGCIASITGTSPDFAITITHGFTADAAIILSTDENGWNADLGEYDELTLVAVANTSRSELRASQADPVIALGYLTTMLDPDSSGEDAVTTFVPVNWDMSSLPGLSGSTQVPYHAGDGKFKLDADGCGGS